VDVDSGDFSLPYDISRSFCCSHAEMIESNAIALSSLHAIILQILWGELPRSLPILRLVNPGSETVYSASSLQA